MVNKQLKPIKINNYNQFLSTLDNKFTNKSEKEKEKEKEKDMKKIIDKIIENLVFDFTPNFTGQTQNDIIMSSNNINDPNEYRYEDKMINVSLNKKIKQCYECSKNTITDITEIKETINIDVEINNIKDILKLIETYKLESHIKYNINMECLHNIKEPLEELDNMIGINEIKNSIVEQILYFIQDLNKDKNVVNDFMHSVIYGPPGTGKTEIAKIMGKIYSKIGILSKGTFKKVKRSDLIAGYLGQTAIKTMDVIKEAIGGVLFIDEAYSLGNSEKRDIFSKECIDTLCEALSDNKSDLMVIIAGYENELKECFFEYNQGLDSRFTWRFKTDDYTYEDLYHIFLKKVKEIRWEIDTDITIDWFKRNKDYFKFYGRDIETILAKTKIMHSKRVFCKPENEKRKIILKDLENGFKNYLKNDNVKNRKNDMETKKYLYNTLYS